MRFSYELKNYVIEEQGVRFTVCALLFVWRNAEKELAITL